MSPANLPLTATVSAAEDVLATAFDHEVVLLDLRDGVYYGLDNVGARIWSLIQGPISLGQVRATLIDEYEVDPARCESDLRNLLTDLVTRQLAVIGDR